MLTLALASSSVIEAHPHLWVVYDETPEAELGLHLLQPVPHTPACSGRRVSLPVLLDFRDLTCVVLLERSFSLTAGSRRLTVLAHGVSMAEPPGRRLEKGRCVPGIWVWQARMVCT